MNQDLLWRRIGANEQAVAERKVVGYRNPDGSANLSGYNLPVDRVAAASGHIDASGTCDSQ